MVGDLISVSVAFSFLCFKAAVRRRVNRAIAASSARMVQTGEAFAALLISTRNVFEVGLLSMMVIFNQFEDQLGYFM
jgi:hypothetical protein